MSKNKTESQQPLPQSIVLSLSAWNCKTKISNSNFETKLNEQVVINNGDSIFVKASYLDTRGSASANIEIVQDTEISLDYYFYWIHTFNACNPSDLTTFAGDKSTDLSQQVLVGGSIPQLYENNKTVNPTNSVSGYFTNNPLNKLTGINDADGLPYLVYESANDIPVPAIIGPEEDSAIIRVGEQYQIASEGLVTNWEMAGVTGANFNKLPNNFILNSSVFLCAKNPNGNIHPADFIMPEFVQPTLPYTKYQITVLGNTKWSVIDPSSAKPVIPASDMIEGKPYVINTIGNLDFKLFGALTNDVGVAFVKNSYPPPPQLPVNFNISNQYIVSELGQKVIYIPDASPVFGADPTDYLSIDITQDIHSNKIIIQDFAGYGAWLSENALPLSSQNEFDINLYDFGLTAAITGVYNPVYFKQIVSRALSTEVGQLIYGVTYKTNVSAGLDGSNFTWNLVTDAFPIYDTFQMVTGTTYQVVSQGCFIPFAAQGGKVSEIFVNNSATPAIIIPQSVSFEGALENSAIFSFYDDNFTEIPGSNIYSVANALFTNNNGVPNLTCTAFEWTNPVFVGIGDIYISVASSELQSQTFQVDSWLFIAGARSDTAIYIATPVATPPAFPQYVYNNIWATPSGVLADFENAFFPCNNPYENTGIPSQSSVVQNYEMTSMILLAGDYIDGSVNDGGYRPGDFINALFPDPDLPADSLGRADLALRQFGSDDFDQYDGTTRKYTPATTKTEIKPVKKKWKMTLKAGSYDPNNLSQIISRSMSRQKVKRVNNVKGAPFGNQSTLNVPTDSIWNSVSTGDIWATNNGTGSNTFFDSKNPKVYQPSPSETNYNINPDLDDMPFLFVPTMTGSTLEAKVSGNSYISAQMPHLHANGLNNIPGSSSNINLIPLISDIKSISPTISSTVVTDGYYSILPFYSQNAITQGSPDTGTSGIFPIAFGSTQTSLLYNNENNSLFSFNYLHSPILSFLSSTTSDLTETTAHMYTTQKVSSNMTGTNFFTTLIDKKSGILLNKMEPASFWNQLGFDIPSLTVDLDDPTKIGFQMTYDEFNSRTTGGFCGSSNIFNNAFHTKGSADQPSVPDTELLFTQVVPAPLSNIKAYTANLTIGTQYIITNTGIIFSGSTQYQYFNDWSSIGGPANPVSDVDTSSGSTFTATGTGFIYPNPYPSDNSYYWTDDPYVIPVNSSTSTTTQLQNNYFEVTNTNPLNAASIPTQRDSAGHYLIEITGYNSIYLDDKSKHEIKSIVSSYYVSANSFVSQPFPDSYNFFHYGSPISLSNIKIRILNPFDMSEAILGPNSSVYLQINKLLTDQSVDQIEN